MQIFAQRRTQLLNQIADNSLVILAAAPEYPFTSGVNYPYHQDSYFYYLTGLSSTPAYLVLYKIKQQVTSLLLTPVNTAKDELWHGKKPALAQLQQQYKFDRVEDIAQTNQIIQPLIEQVQKVYLDTGKLEQNEQLAQILTSHGEIAKLANVRPLIDQMRLIKDSLELDNMRRAVEISTQAHLEVMRECRPGSYEYTLAGKFVGHCISSGAAHQGYPPIVAAGANALTLHYTDNNQPLQDGDLLLIDAACEYNHYSADITRTYPVNGKFSSEQAAIYQLVLDAQQAAIAVIKPGVAYELIHAAAVECLVSGLLELKILTGDKQQIIADKAYQEFYPHSTGHWLGLDVHDVGNYKLDGQSMPLQENMLLTVEPGLYIRSGSSAASKWHGIGVRIEDDILVTSSTAEVLSAQVPKAIAEISRVMRGG
jgi:Xaa-Pro aminopeptidase